MRPTRRRVLFGLGAITGGAGLESVRWGDGRTALRVSSDRDADTGYRHETTTGPETTTERNVEFPERFAEISFDTRESLRTFTTIDSARNAEIDERGVTADSNSLRVTFQEDKHYGTSIHYRFEEADYPEPETLHARYFIRFADSFDLSNGGGKLPGPAGTYGQAGWGGRQADGTNGWSARMYFYPSQDPDHPVQLSNYVYHTDMDGPYGDIFEWDESDAGRLHLGRWYRIDSYVEMNTPGRNDGVLKGWVDGNRTLNVEDLRFRDVPQLRIADYWFNCYWGGSWHSPSDNHVYFDQLTLFSERQDSSDWRGTETE